MIKKLILSIISLFILWSILSGCLETENNQNITNNLDRFYGTWTNTSILGGEILKLTYTFYSNNSYLITGLYKQNESSSWGIWDIDGNKIMIQIEGINQTGYYEFIDNNNLSITDGNNNVIVLTKN